MPTPHWHHLRSLQPDGPPQDVILRRRRVALLVAAVLFSACLGAAAALSNRFSRPASSNLPAEEERVSLDQLKEALGAGLQAEIRSDFPDHKPR